VREHHQDRDDGDADDAKAARRAAPAGVEEGLEDRNQPPREHHPVECKERSEDLWCDDPRGQSRRRPRLDEQEPDHEDDERWDEEECREAGPSIEELAEPRDHGREACRGESAAIRGPGVGADLGCLSAGLQDETPLSVAVAAAADVRAESTRTARGMVTPGDRSACHDRPASCL
jgi:hypothetical protein